MSMIRQYSRLWLTALLPLVLRTPTLLGNEPPLADAGLPRYAATVPVQLDGASSYDPDAFGPLTYAWTQVSGPAVDISGADTATPTVSGFVQTESVQKCEFALVVSDGELMSRPDRVSVVVVPSFGAPTMRLENTAFDPAKPTFIYFGGGVTCALGYTGQYVSHPDFIDNANVIDFPFGYEPDGDEDPRTYFHYGDMIIVYLSSVAPNYRLPIQTAGWSAGGQPALDVGLHLNSRYADARYAVNRVTLLDVGYCLQEPARIEAFRSHPVDGEQCWVDSYIGVNKYYYPNVINVDSSLSHSGIRDWYASSFAAENANRFNGGVIGGAYWALWGPGKNLQLAFTPGEETYSFLWSGDAVAGHMELDPAADNQGRLPEPITLLGPPDGTLIAADGGVLSCQISTNAVGYQLLFGRDPDHLIYLYSDTPAPPAERVTAFPFEHTWWTVQAYDQYGSTIHGDPKFVQAEVVIHQAVRNATTKREYASIQEAINDALEGDEIELDPGVFEYFENLDFKGKALTLRSTDARNPSVVAATTVAGHHWLPTVALPRGASEPPMLDGLTIVAGTTGISCRDASPTIVRCTIQPTGGSAVEYWEGYEPAIMDCDILGDIVALDDPRMIAHWKLDEAEGMIAHDSTGTNDATLLGTALWLPDGGMIDGALQLSGAMNFATANSVRDPSEGPLSVFAWIKGGGLGQVIVSQQGGANWLMVDGAEGSLRTELRSSNRQGTTLTSQAMITEGDWHRVGFTCDGETRILYVDDIEVARDTQGGLAGSTGKLLLGAARDFAPGTFWSGLIDDVRIYDRAVMP